MPSPRRVNTSNTSTQITLTAPTQASETLPAQIFSYFDTGLGMIADKVIEIAEKFTPKVAKYVPSFLRVPENYLQKMVIKLARPLTEFTETCGKRTPTTLFTPLHYFDASFTKFVRGMWPKVHEILTLTESTNAFSKTVEDLAKKHLILKSDANITIKDIVEKARSEYENAIIEYLQTNQLPRVVENARKVSAHHTVVWLERAAIAYAIPIYGTVTWYISSWTPVPLPTFVVFTIVSFLPWTYLAQSKIPHMLSESENISIPEIPDVNTQIKEGIKKTLSTTLKNQTKSPDNFLNNLAKIDMNTTIADELKKNPFKTDSTETPPAESKEKTTQKESKQEEEKDIKRSDETELKRVASDDETEKLSKSDKSKKIKELKNANKTQEKRIKQIETDFYKSNQLCLKKSAKLEEERKVNKNLQTEYQDLKKQYQQAIEMNERLQKAPSTLTASPSKATDTDSEEERVQEITEEKDVPGINRYVSLYDDKEKIDSTSKSSKPEAATEKSIVKSPEEVTEKWYNKLGFGGSSSSKTSAKKQEKPITPQVPVDSDEEK